jgi:hypothetical protein
MYHLYVSSISTQHLYTVVLDVRDTLTSPDTIWTYFQTCIKVKDALGIAFTVPAECDYHMLVTIIQRRFETGAGAIDVYARNYELCITNKRSELITDGTKLAPGIAITMAIIITSATATSHMSCPIPGCGSQKVTTCPGGAYIWYVSEILFTYWR